MFLCHKNGTTLIEFRCNIKIILLVTLAGCVQVSEVTPDWTETWAREGYSALNSVARGFFFSFWNVLRIFFLYIIYGHSAVSMCQKNVLSVLAVFWNLVYYLSVRLHIQWTLYINGGIWWAEFSLMVTEKNRLLSYIRCLACLKGTTVGNIVIPPPVAVCSSANLMSAQRPKKRWQCTVYSGGTAVHTLCGPLHSSRVPWAPESPVEIMKPEGQLWARVFSFPSKEKQMGQRWG